MTRALSQDMFSSSQEVPKHVGHSAAALPGQEIEKRVRERRIGSARKDVCWKSESRNLPRSSVSQIQIYSDKLATSMNFHALVAYPFYVLWLNFTEKRRR